MTGQNKKNSVSTRDINLSNSDDYFVLDLFAGCGGLSLGIKSASPRFRIVAAIDNDSKAIESYKFNLVKKNETICLPRDLSRYHPSELETELNNSQLPRPEIIIGGPPCPGFSTIGRSKIMGLIRSGKWELSEERHQFVDDPRNKLFYEFVKFVAYFKPKAFIFENVKGLASYKMKQEGVAVDIIDLIKSEFSKVGYLCQEKLVNSADFGVPQFRDRYFIVGLNLSSTMSFNFRFPMPTHGSVNDLRQSALTDFEGNDGFKKRMKRVTSIQALIDLERFPGVVEIPVNLVYDSRNNIENVIKEYAEKYGRQLLSDRTSDFPEMRQFLRTVQNQNDVLITGGGNPGKINCHYPRAINELGDREIFPLLRSEPGLGGTFIYRDLPSNLKRYGEIGFQDKMRRIPWWKPSWTIIAHLALDGYMFIHPDTDQDRSITAREAARLQSFPDSFDFSAGGEISRGHQFRHIGNAVPPLVARSLGTSLIQWLDRLPNR